MRVGIATDHGGFGLKEELVAHLRAAGHEVVDFGAHGLNPGDDYPDFVIPLARAVAAGTVERGVAVCGSGVGASVCANKIPGVRAGLVHDHFSARQGVEDDHMNIICMGGRTIGPSRGLGPRRDVSGGRVQSSRASPAPSGQSGFARAGTDQRPAWGRNHTAPDVDLYRPRSVVLRIVKGTGHDAPAAVAAVNQKISGLARRKP